MWLYYKAAKKVNMNKALDVCVLNVTTAVRNFNISLSKQHCYSVSNCASINETHNYIVVPADHLCMWKVVVILKVKNILTDIL